MHVNVLIHHGAGCLLSYYEVVNILYLIMQGEHTTNAANIVKGFMVHMCSR